MPQDLLPDLRSMAEEGLEHHRAGRLTQAARRYRQILEIDSDDPDALHLLGTLALQIGDADLAVRLIGKAIAEKADIPTFHCNLASALLEQGRVDHAIAAYVRALASKPDLPVAYYNMGNALLQTARLDDAIACYGRALVIVPTMAEAYCNFGQAMRIGGRADLAALFYGIALALKPDYSEALYNFGNALKDTGKMLQAEACYRHALCCRQDFPEAHSNLGNVLLAQARPEEAVENYRLALRGRPRFAEEHYNLGNAQLALGRLAEASDCFRRALSLKPDYAEAFNNLGLAMHRREDFSDTTAYRRALTLRPDFVDAHFNLGAALLRAGDFQNGWLEYGWRWQSDGFSSTRRLSAQPMWQGEPLDGQVIFLHAEQGIGDAIQFIRYLPLVAARGGRILLEIHQPLMRLTANLTGLYQIIARGDDPPHFDLHCPLMSLPKVFATSLDSIPATIPYLQVVPEDVAHWRKLLPSDGVKVGIVWQGNPLYAHDHARSIPSESLMPLASVAEGLGIHWVSLQKQPAEKPPFMEMADPMDQVEDFYDTAAVIANLDLVIAVDTAVAHLAGAIGRPVWLLNRFDSDWRWLLDRQDSPWYPTMRIFRQTARDDWHSVIGDVIESLRKQFGPKSISEATGDFTLC